MFKWFLNFFTTTIFDFYFNSLFEYHILVQTKTELIIFQGNNILNNIIILSNI